MPITRAQRELAKQLADRLDCRILQHRPNEVLLDKAGWFGPQWHRLSELRELNEAECADANREMGLPEDGDWVNK